MIKARVGEKCPQGGTWHPEDDKTKERSIGFHNIMPPTQTKSDVWVLKKATGDK